MELWLLALIAFALIPTVRLFMAAGCRREPAPPGAEDLTVEVTADPNNPNDPPELDADVEITGGRLDIDSPSARSLGDSVPRGGFFPGRVFDITPDLFSSAEPPYRWNATCSVSWECVAGPAALRGTGSTSAVHSFEWDANRDLTVRFVLRIVDDSRETGGVIPDPTRVHSYRWELTHA